MSEPQRTSLKHPNSAYLIVAFALLCATAVVRSPLLALVYLIPIGGAWYVARTATIVDEAGITARAMFGSYTVPWADLAGLRLNDKSAVYAVARDGTQTRLPCVRATRLAPLISASAGRIPDPAVEAEPSVRQPLTAQPGTAEPETAQPETAETETGRAETPEASGASDNSTADVQNSRD